MVQIQRNTSFKMFTSLACSLSVLHQNVMAHLLGEEIPNISPSAQVLFRTHPETTSAADSYLDVSRTNYNRLQEKIHASVAKGNIIHVEDGEGDDILHDVVAIFGNLPPQQVYMCNGYHELRKASAEKTWEYLSKKHGIKKPEIFTIGGSFSEDLSSFDKAEGSGMFKPEEIEWLRGQSLVKNEKYDSEVTKAQQALRETLTKNDFTTIVVKTAPGGMTGVLKDFQDKCAIVWTGPIRKLAHSDGWEIKFNYFRAGDDSDTLLKLKIPIIIASPYVGNAKMSAIIDSKFMSAYRRWMPLHEDYRGFEGLATIAADENTLVAHYINGLADQLMENVIQALPAGEEGILNLKKEALQNFQREFEKLCAGQQWMPLYKDDLGSEDLAAINPDQDNLVANRVYALVNEMGNVMQALPSWKNAEKEALRNLQLNIIKLHKEYDKKLKDISNTETATLSLGRRWSDLRKEEVGNERFREYCPLDLFAAVPTDKVLGSSVKEVLEVSMERLNRREIKVEPSNGSNVFIISQIDSDPLHHKIQEVINWMAQGERQKFQRRERGRDQLQTA